MEAEVSKMLPVFTLIDLSGQLIEGVLCIQLNLMTVIELLVCPVDEQP